MTNNEFQWREDLAEAKAEAEQAIQRLIAVASEDADELLAVGFFLNDQSGEVTTLLEAEHTDFDIVAGINRVEEGREFDHADDLVLES